MNSWQAETSIERKLDDQKHLLVNLSRGLRGLRGGGGERPPALGAMLVEAVADHVLAHLRVPGNQGETRVEGLREIVVRAAVTPAMTSFPTWAAELSQPANVGVFAALAPASAYSRLAARGLRVDVSGSSSIRLPMRSTPGDLAAAFVGEGVAIPVKSAGLAAASLGPKKMGVISFFSAELAKRSRPTIESVIRQLMAEDTSAALDAVFLGSAAGTTVQPAGLRYNVTPIAPATGGGAVAASADIGALLAAISPAADPVLVMGEADRARMLGLCPGYIALAVETTSALPPKVVMAIDAGALVTGEGDTPEISVGTDVVIHASDTPLAIGTPGSPAVVAAPTVSAWQSNLLGIRLIADCGWTMRAAAKVATTGPVTW